MRHLPEKNDDLDLGLPALDGEEFTHDDPVRDEAFDVADEDEDALDALDDGTGEDAPFDELTVDGPEAGWLADAEGASALDVGAFDVVIQPEGKVLEDDEADDRELVFSDLISEDESVVADGGEEGPLAADDELREEDLPALDADEDGDVPDEDLFDRSLFALAGDDELRWDDRAWARAAPLSGGADEDESGVLAVPGEDSTQGVRDAAWRRLEATGRAMVATFVPGGSVVVALSTPDRARAWIVRIQPDGDARIIVEIDPRATKVEDDGDACVVTFLRWDGARKCLFVGGNFGVEAYEPV